MSSVTSATSRPGPGPDESREPPMGQSPSTVADKVHKYSENEFMKLFENTDRVIFPANFEVTISGFNKKMGLRGVQDPYNTKTFIQIINDILLPVGKRLVLAITEGQPKLSYLFSQEGASVSFQGTKEFVFTTIHGQIESSIGNLISRTERLGHEELNIKPSSTLVLELSERDKKYLDDGTKNLLERICALFLSKSPNSKSFKPNFFGVTTIKLNLINKNNEVLSAITLSGDSGIKISRVQFTT